MVQNQKEKQMIKKKTKKNTIDINQEYLYSLMNDLGLLNERELYEANITSEEWENPTEQTLERLEIYKQTRKK